jgi:hypothetical protein
MSRSHRPDHNKPIRNGNEKGATRAVPFPPSKDKNKFGKLVAGRAGRVPALDARGAAPAAGRGHRHDRARRRDADVSGALISTTID